jgi:hypothetical protein
MEGTDVLFIAPACRFGYAPPERAELVRWNRFTLA